MAYRDGYRYKSSQVFLVADYRYSVSKTAIVICKTGGLRRHHIYDLANERASYIRIRVLKSLLTSEISSIISSPFIQDIEYD